MSKAKSMKTELRDHALFIAFAPADQPKIALAVLVENGGFGAQAAAPIARQVLDYYLLGKLPKGPASSQEDTPTADTPATDTASNTVDTTEPSTPLIPLHEPG
jgi:penicillin-binding protein 2